MIYELDKHHIDLSKLECVSGIDYVSNKSVRGYCFRYQINGYVWDSHINNELKTTNKRNKLINIWKIYKENYER